MTEAVLRVAGVEYRDLENLSVTMGVEQFAREFSAKVSDRLLEASGQPLPFEKGQDCELLIDGTIVVDGFIDDIPISYDANNHEFAVIGRSNVGDMVDSCAVHKSGAWAKATLDTILRDLAAPYGIAVTVDPTVAAMAAKPFRRFAIEDEERTFDCMMRACQARGLFVVSDAGNSITITGAGKVAHAATLMSGPQGNVLSGRRSGSYRDRFSEYTIKSQNAGDDTWHGDIAASQHARVLDPRVSRYRPMILVSETQGAKPDLDARASWERNFRAGASERYEYTLPELADTAGVMWTPNQLVQVVDPYMGLTASLLIASVGIEIGSDEGVIANLELVSPNAFNVFVPPSKGGPTW
jgi:prophage tail gpP-like protein